MNKKDLDKKKFEAQLKILDFIKERGYTYTIEAVIGSYILYVKPKKYTCYSMQEIMKNVGGYVRLIADGVEY